jgi:signal transduction histidine kinase
MEKSLFLLIGKYIHKLNGQVGLIRANIAIFQMKKANLLKQDQTLANTLKEIEERAKTILLLTDEFKLSFTIPESEESVLVEVALSDALRSIVVPESIIVDLEVDEGIPEVRATRNLIDVFRNLATNAFEAMPNGGKLQVSVKVNQSKERVEMTFSDTGRGVPTYITDSLLFQPYFSTKDEEGHGLGLWWSRAYLESIGGNLELLRSDVGKGSDFLVSLPLAKPG